MEMPVNGMAPVSEAKTCQLHQEQKQRRKRNAFSILSKISVRAVFPVGGC